MDKFRGRCKEICERRLPIKMAIEHFSISVAAVLGYKAQMVPPRDRILK